VTAIRRLILLAALAGLAGLLAACGKVGPVRAPSDAENTYPGQYPPPDSVLPPAEDEGDDSQ